MYSSTSDTLDPDGIVQSDLLVHRVDSMEFNAMVAYE